MVTATGRTGRLEGEVALVTGGASGLGRAIVDRFVAEGARVAVLDRSAEGLDAVCREHGERVGVTRGDVRDVEANERAVSDCVAAFSKLDCAIANAGIWDYSRPLVDLDPNALAAGFDELLAVNAKGPVLLARAALPALVRSSGSFLVTISNAGFYPDGGGALYTMSKHALVGLVRQLAFEWAPAVRVNGIAPGPIETDLRGPEALGLADTSIRSVELGKHATAFVPLGRVPTPAEYASAYVFFAARDGATPATGSILNVDGGLGARGLSRVSGGAKLRARFRD
jgi:NAD(P)-dependent dehydrogenase (short-subunit alcohol dehydrogenase family)